MSPANCFLLLMLISFSVIKSLVIVAAQIHDDEASLLAFKAAAIRGTYGDTLSSWNSSSAGEFCSWEGVTCRGRPPRVVALSLPNHKLIGVLSSAVGNLSYLRVLNLSYNGFTGEIPASLGRLQRLQALNLSHNAFSGEIPANLSSCTSLSSLVLRFNNFHGRIPTELGKLTRLRFLNLGNNSLTGVIPASLANLSSLSFMYLSFNHLEGPIPPGICGIRGLRSLALAFNHLSGELPNTLQNLSSLEMLQVQGNMLRGGIPAEISSWFPNIWILNLYSNKFTGSIPASLSNLTKLEIINLFDNNLSGYLPLGLGRLRALRIFDIASNRLEADQQKGWEFITSLSNCSQLQDLSIGHNAGLTGQLPSSIVNLSTSLQHLMMHSIGISGRIPSAIGNLVNLQRLSLSNTDISGVIPDSISKMEQLGMLHLSNTKLSGPIPSSIGNLTTLTILRASNGTLEGLIPASLGKLKNLIAIDMSMNRLNGSIPRDIFKLPSLSIYLNLAYNSLSGPLPSEVSSLTNLNRLFLSGNQLSGEIPNSIGDCAVLQELWLNNNSFEGRIPQSLTKIKGLSALDFSRNKLSGAIPEGIGGIRELKQLYLAHNNLSGTIPTDLQNLTSLSKLDLSFNNLQGEVPKEGIFTNLTYQSIIGNSKLCGGIPQLNLTPCQMKSLQKSRNRWSKSLTIAVATTGALLFSVFVIALIQLTHKKLGQRQKTSFLPALIEERYGRVSYHALANGTNEFSEDNLLGKGSFGAVYKCTLDEGVLAAVKVFDLETSRSTKSFVAECEALTRVRHRCLIKIITCCSSINHQGQEFKALVFEFMPNGSLHDWLHPKSDMPLSGITLSLAHRLNIAVDVMDALDYLHNHCQPQVIHCDLKPSNILLAEDMSARVGDFGISRILPEHASESLQNSNSTSGIRGSIGYVAPEYGEGSSISTLGDVYSLGILLLEMFTGKSPTDDMFKGSFDLHKFSEDAIPHRIWEIVDSTMWLDRDTFDSTTRSRIENCLVSVVALGLSCSKKQPRERTQIHDAAIKMHDIRDSYLKFARYVVVDNGVGNTFAVICTTANK